MPKTSRTTGPSGTGRTEDPVRPSNTIAAVAVSNPDTDERPDTPQVVIWVGGTERPANMNQRDLWFGQSNAAVFDYSNRPDLVATLLAKSEFHIAHRGCGAEAPEHSETSYRQSLGRGYEAVEMSAHTTSDGVQVCHHDATLDRTTTLTGNIADFSLGQLRAAIMDYGSLIGPGWATAQPLPILGTELSLWAHNGVVFLEPKADGPRTLAAATQFPEPGKFIVWKFNRSSNGSLPSHAVAARAAGLRLWVYMTQGDANSLVTTVAATADVIGMPIEATDAEIAFAVATGVPVIVFTVQTRKERDRCRALGVQGYMDTSVSYVGNDLAQFTTDGFAGGTRRPGEVEGASNKLITLDAAGGLVTLAQGTTATLGLGSMSPVANAAGSYTIDYAMRWPTLPGATEHSDVYFGHTMDDPYAHQAATNLPGYHTVVRANGQVQLFSHVFGSTTGTQIGSTVASATPVANTFMTFRITVTASTVLFQRLDDASAQTGGASTLVRGGYFGLASASSSIAPQFRDITVA